MSESFIDRLSRFTPDGAGLDRDRVLFEAGRASARPRGPWRALCASLAATQLITLSLWLWPRSLDVAPTERTVPPMAERPTPVPVAQVPTHLDLREQAVATEGNLPATAPVECTTVSESPLYALALPASLLD
jgi:hypothetical protein